MDATDKVESFEVTYNNEKYEIANFINRHPGGIDVLLPLKGKDITQAFDHIGHSDAAKRMLRKRLIAKDNTPAAAESTEAAGEESAKIDGKFIVKKLFTAEDKFNTHKTLGFLCLLSYIYRYFYVFPTTGTLGMKNDFFTYLTLLVHTLLSCSSLIFHVLRHRIKDNPLIIYEEYRLHAILFTVKSVFATIYALNIEHVHPQLRAPILVVSMLGSHVMADLITWKFGKKGVTAVRNENKSTGFIKFGMYSYAFYQLIGQGCVLKYFPGMEDLGFNALIAIQSSAFLMTLKRKNIIDLPIHAAGYSVCLFLSTMLIWWYKGPEFFAIVTAIFIARTQFNANKYLLWTSYVALAYFVL